MRNEFNEFRTCYCEYLQEYYKLVFIKTWLGDRDLSETVKQISTLLDKLRLLSMKLRLQMHDVFVDQKEKAAYIASVKKFVLMEFSEWEKRQPHAEKHPWSTNVHREWMPNCLHDILKEVEEISAEKNVPVIAKKKITAFQYALFCSIVHQSGNERRGDDENAMNFCARVLKKFNLNPFEGPAIDSIRKDFSEGLEIKKADKNLKIVEDFLISKLPANDRKQIAKFIQTEIMSVNCQ